ncbi:MAG: DUF4870 domain-containing protein [archaeon]
MDKSTVKTFGALAHIAGVGWATVIGVVFSIILIVKAEKDREAKLLGWQGLFWCIAVLVIIAITSIFLLIPIAGWIIWWIIQIAILVLSILWAMKIYNGKKVKIPFISDWAGKMAK